MTCVLSYTLLCPTSKSPSWDTVETPRLKVIHQIDRP